MYRDYQNINCNHKIIKGKVNDRHFSFKSKPEKYNTQCIEIIRILTAIIKSTKAKQACTYFNHPILFIGIQIKADSPIMLGLVSSDAQHHLDVPISNACIRNRPPKR